MAQHRTTEATMYCRRCGYQLTGLSEDRCPECGYAFDWPDLLELSRRLQPYLFEHHPGMSGVRPWGPCTVV